MKFYRISLNRQDKIRKMGLVVAGRNYFEINQHTIDTRNGSFLIKLPKVNLEVGKQSFAFMGANIYNKLPLKIRKLNFNDFGKILKFHFGS